MRDDGRARDVVMIREFGEIVSSKVVSWFLVLQFAFVQHSVSLVQQREDRE